MSDVRNINGYSFNELSWDTDYFGVSCAKAILNKALSDYEWKELQNRFEGYQFVSIENRNSEIANSQLIGRYTTAFLADTNIQFSKNVEEHALPDTVRIYRGMSFDKRVIDLADFKYSKFLNDPEFSKRKGEIVYLKWLENSFGKQDKYFGIVNDLNNKLSGFILFSYIDDVCVLELMAVAKDMRTKGIAMSLLAGVEYTAYEKGSAMVRVGTQSLNTNAINLYYKLGFKQIACHQVYHLWDL